MSIKNSNITKLLPIRPGILYTNRRISYGNPNVINTNINTYTTYGTYTNISHPNITTDNRIFQICRRHTDNIRSKQNKH
jgi:hypothetical protein